MKNVCLLSSGTIVTTQILQFVLDRFYSTFNSKSQNYILGEYAEFNNLNMESVVATICPENFKEVVGCIAELKSV